MQTQVRLAERQGLLKGFQLSPVQYYVLSVLNLLDAIVIINNEDRELRLAMLSSGDWEAKSLFPEQFGVVVDDDNAELPDETDAQGQPIATKYDFSNATYDPKKVEAEIKEMLARAAISEATFDQPQYTDWI